MSSRYVRAESPGIRPLPFHFNFSRNQRREFYSWYYSQLFYNHNRGRRNRRKARPYYHHQAHQQSGQHRSQQHRDVLHRTRRYAGIARRQRGNYPPPGSGKKARKRRQRWRQRQRRQQQQQQGPPTPGFRAVGPDGEVLTPSMTVENQQLLQTLPMGYGRRLTYRDIQITAPNPTALFRAVERLRQKRPSPEIKIEHDDYDDEVHLENYPLLPSKWDISPGEVSYG